jgi:hypothetical protein
MGHLAMPRGPIARSIHIDMDALHAPAKHSCAAFASLAVALGVAILAFLLRTTDRIF